MPPTSNNQIYTVTRLTAEIKNLLEDKFSFIWINGEIGNLYSATSGHIYFDLKDQAATIKAVIFKGQAINLQFTPENGLEVTGFGRISVFGPRSTYQIILEYLEPAGIGALQVAFEQLKKKLNQEGLFDEIHKKPLPFLPRKIGVVTSPTGAVIHDIIHVLFRRYDNLHLLVVPAKVRGNEAEEEIVCALDNLNRYAKVDLVILARGGGSLEDLQAFNSETVARAIFTSKIPVVSAIGHEVDYTIADFVADYRAPTPSAAAEIIIPEKKGLKNKIERIKSDLKRAVRNQINDHRYQLEMLVKSLKNPRNQVEDHRMVLDHRHHRMVNCINRIVEYKQHQTSIISFQLINKNPKSYITKFKQLHENLHAALSTQLTMYLAQHRSRLNQHLRTLTALNPMAILERGYSITRTVGSEFSQIVLDANQVEPHQRLEVLLAKGSLEVRVNKTRTSKR